MENETTFNEEALIKSNKKKVKIIIITVVMLITAIITLTVFGIYTLIQNSPKMKVYKAIKATYEQVKRKEEFTQKITDKDFLKNLQQAGTKQSLQMVLNSSNDINLRKFNGCDFKADSLYDENNKKLMGDFVTGLNGKEFVNAEFYTDNKQLMLSMPKLYNGWFVCDTENIQNQYNSSVFAENKKQLPFKEFTLKFFNDDDSKEYQGKELMNVIISDYLSENQESLEKIASDIKVSKLKETKILQEGDKKERCTGYYILIPGNDAKTFVDSVCDYMLEDNQIKKTITKEVKYLYLADNKKYNNPEAMEDDIYSQMNDYVSKIKDSFTCEDVGGTVYIDSKGRAMSIEDSGNINVNDEKDTWKSSIDFKGNNNAANIIKMSMNLDGDKDKINVNLNSNSTEKDDVLNDETNFAVKINKEPISYKRKYQYNKKSGEFNSSASIALSNKGLSGSFNGTGSYDENSKTLKLNFSNIDLESTIGPKPIGMSLTGSYSVSPMEKKIDPPAGEKLEIFKLTKEQLASIGEKIKNNIRISSGLPSIENQKF